MSNNRPFCDCEYCGPSADRAAVEQAQLASVRRLAEQFKGGIRDLNTLDADLRRQHEDAPFTPDHRDEAERALTDEDTPLATAHALFILADSIEKFTRELRLNTLTHHRATLPPGSPSAITAREHIETGLGL